MISSDSEGASVEDDAAFGRELVAMAPNMRAFAISLSRRRGEGDVIATAALLKAWRSHASFQRLPFPAGALEPSLAAAV